MYIVSINDRKMLHMVCNLGSPMTVLFLYHPTICYDVAEYSPQKFEKLPMALFSDASVLFVLELRAKLHEGLVERALWAIIGPSTLATRSINSITQVQASW